MRYAFVDVALVVSKKSNVGCMEHPPQNLLLLHLDIIKQIIGRRQQIVSTSYIYFLRSILRLLWNVNSGICSSRSKPNLRL